MSLLECNISYLSPAIPSPNDATVVCQAQSTQIANCSNGDIRLVNGTNELEGRLEICINNAWGSVCSQGFTEDDAKVVCQQIKFPFNGMLILLTVFQTTCIQRDFIYLHSGTLVSLMHTIIIVLLFTHSFCTIMKHWDN